jgi:hypothetical protein
VEEMKYLLSKGGYTLIGCERITNHRTCKVKFNVVREKDQKIIEVKGPDYEETLKMLDITIDILEEFNKNRQKKGEKILYLDEIIYIEPSYGESLIDLEGPNAVPQMWHVYMVDDEDNLFLALTTYRPKSIEEGLKVFEHLCHLTVPKDLNSIKARFRL